MSDNFELTSPEPPPRDQRLEEWSDLVGQTILAAIESPGGEREADLVLITDTRCWMVLSAQMDGCSPEDGTSIEIVREYGFDGRPKQMLSDFVSAVELHHAGVISTAEFEGLKLIEQRKKEEQRQERVARLRAELTKLGEEPTP